MDCEYSYKFTETAENDLDGILRYITVDLCNPSAAKDFFEKLFDNIGVICSFPETGVIVENEYITDKSVRKLLIDNYICYYKAVDAEKTIYVLRIVYARRNQNEIVRSIDEKD